MASALDASLTDKDHLDGGSKAAAHGGPLNRVLRAGHPPGKL